MKNQNRRLFLKAILNGIAIMALPKIVAVARDDKPVVKKVKL
jgi:hypothetical protein